MSDLDPGVMERPAKPSPLPLYLTARIDILPDGRFRLDGDKSAIIVPVRDRHGLICELVAYLDGDPGSWLLKEGDQCPVLGAKELAGAPMVPGPIHLFPTPSDWVDAGGCGVCIIDWDAPLFDLFRDVEIELGHLEDTAQRAMRDRLWGNFKRDMPRIYGGWKRGRQAA